MIQREPAPRRRVAFQDRQEVQEVASQELGRYVYEDDTPTPGAAGSAIVPVEQVEAAVAPLLFEGQDMNDPRAMIWVLAR